MILKALSYPSILTALRRGEDAKGECVDSDEEYALLLVGGGMDVDVKPVDMARQQERVVTKKKIFIF
jgi:hypothetical protein